MPTYRIEVDEQRDDRLREIARRDHRPVLWQAEQLLAKAIDGAGRELADDRQPAEAMAS